MRTIIGKAEATAEQMAAYLLSVNPEPKIKMDPVAFCRLFLYIGALEGVRGDALFSQSCHETGNFVYTGTVTPDQNNYAGLGTTDVNTPGATFPDEATGILAQAQHAKGYYGAPLTYDCVDPRYELLVKYGKIGTAKYWEKLGGAWAVPGYAPGKYSSLQEAEAAKDSYGYKITKILDKILAMPIDGKAKEEAEEEVKTENTKPLAGKKFCIDAGHFAKYNRSPGVPEYYESEAMWKLHLLLKAELEALGAEVVTTRADQSTDLDLQTRGKKSAGCTAFLSLHSNAEGEGMNEAIDYVAAYHLTADSTTQADDISKELAQMLAPAIAEVMGTTQGSKVLTRQSSNDRNGDGVMNDNYYAVLHGARLVNVPGIILEHSFHTNTRATKWLLVDANLAKLAKAEAACIARCFSGQQVTPEVVAPAGKYYRVRKSWGDAASQRGAFGYLENAKRHCPEGFTVYDWNGVAVYTRAAAEVKVEAAKSFDRSLTGFYEVKASDGLHLRAGASADKASLEVMPAGSEFRCYGYHSGDWLYGVSASDKVGFCHKAYLVKN